MKYPQAISYLDRLQKERGMLLGLERVRKVLQALGNPQNEFKSILIAGTNGKGSVASALSAILHANGKKVGLYTSPHLADYTERIRINETDLSRSKFAQYLTQSIQAAKNTKTKLTVFELLTVAAFLAFRAKRVEWAVLEVGLGGRLDATNIVNADLSIITNISLEHTALLGKTVEMIAKEKAGIIKPKGIVLTGTSGKALLRIIKIAAQNNARLVIPEKRSVQIRSNLTGAYQQANLALAVKAAKLIGEKVQSGSLMKIRWPGRFQIVGKNPILIFDGAHNPDGMKTLMAVLHEYKVARPLTMVFGLQSDKDFINIIKLIDCQPQNVILTQSNHPNSLNPMRLLRSFQKTVGIDASIQVITNPSRALGQAVKENKTGTILICGSLYLVGEILRRNRRYVKLISAKN
jgi:dihydrofolate synthase/folylpolyglutamate synthase